MAEIDIEKKSGGGKVWLWVIIALIVAGLLYWWFAGDGDEPVEEIETEAIEDETAMAEENTTTWEEETAATDVDIDEPSEFAEYIGNEQKMGLDHEYTNNALVYLVDTLESEVEESDLDLNAEWQEVRAMADRITEDPLAETHANTIKEAGLRISSILLKLQEQANANLTTDVEEVRTAAQNIQKDVLTLNQKDQIMAFYEESADVLQKLS